MTLTNTTRRFAAIAAVAFSLASPLLMAVPANAEPYRIERSEVRNERTRELAYRDIHWREARFDHRHCAARGDFEHARFVR